MAPKNPMDKVSDRDRRQFLDKAGRFAAVTPPTVALMLSATGRARSGHLGHYHDRYHHHDGDAALTVQAFPLPGKLRLRPALRAGTVRLPSR